MATGSAARLEQLRALAHRYGVPLDCVDRLSLRPREVAQVTGFSRSKVDDWIASGRLPSVRVDSCVSVLVSDLISFLEQHRRVGVSGDDLTLDEKAERFLKGLPS